MPSCAQNYRTSSDILVARPALSSSGGVTISFGACRSEKARAVAQRPLPARMHDRQVRVRDWGLFGGARCATDTVPKRQTHGLLTSRRLPAAIAISKH